MFNLILLRCCEATLPPGGSSSIMAGMQFRLIAVALLSPAFLCIGPHSAFADDSPPGREVVITPGKAAPPSGAGKRTVVLAGPFPPAAPPAANKSSQQTTSKTSTPTASPPPAPPAAPAAPPPPSPPPATAATSRAAASSRAKPRVVPRKRARSHASAHGGRGLRVTPPPVARGGPSEAQTQRADPIAPAIAPAVAASATPAAVAAPPPRTTTASDSLKWVVPVAALAGLLALLAAIRFAYWRWAIRRSRHQVANGFDSKPGEHASKDAYPVYRGTRRWGGAPRRLRHRGC